MKNQYLTGDRTWPFLENKVRHVEQYRFTRKPFPMRFKPLLQNKLLTSGLTTRQIYDPFILVGYRVSRVSNTTSNVLTSELLIQRTS